MSGGWIPPSDAPPPEDRPPSAAPQREDLPGTTPSPAPRYEEPATPPAAPASASWPGAAPVAARSGDPGGWGSRAVATLLDALITTAIVAVPMALGAILFVAGEGAGVAGLVIGFFVGFLVSLVYAPYMLATRNGQTIGKKVMNVRVVMGDGSPIGGGRAVVRELVVKGLLVGFVGGLTFYILTLLDYLWPLWDEKSEALHDKMCDTRVVKA